MDTSDFRYFLDMARLADQGAYPYIHFWVEYPPVYPWIVVGTYKLSHVLATGVAAERWFYGLLSALLVACEVALLFVLHRLALLLGSREDARRGLWIYALCFVPVYLWTGWFDSIPTLLFLGSLYLLLTHHDRFSAVAAGLGVVTKLFPLLLLPLALCALRGVRRQAVYLFIAGGVIALFVVPFGLV